eukprot:TRINITY_DN7515_c0_g2_i6.p1 TRINITY_DN7515_c0_g2~~TRINITY_DN7515_c0_g2_i6.p1  ORF type:complete len:251 (-),score=83.41 TRINITY_DN7515_c0_g2_i6:255-1007(-)
MRRGVGIAALHQKQQSQKTFQQVGSEMQKAEMQQMKEQMEIFKNHLEDFARKHKKEINKNPQFRKNFTDMCSKIGVDPLLSNKGFWAEILGVGSFYYELAVQIIDICLKTRSTNGGLIEVSEIKNYLEKIRGKHAQSISSDDIKRATESIKILGNGFQMLTVGSKKMIQSVPVELNQDHTTILLIAESKGWTTVSEIKKEFQEWKENRIQSVLDLLLRESIAWVDDQSETGQRAYWFPSLIAGSLTTNEI